MPCEKVRLSEFRAHAALASIRKHRTSRRSERRVYYCNPCGAWHLTSDISRLYQRKEMRKKKNAKLTKQAKREERYAARSL